MSAILPHHGIKTTTPFADAHGQKHAMLPAAWEHPVRWARYVAANYGLKILNPVYYAELGALQQMVYHRQSFASVDELRRAVVKAWEKLSQSFLDKSIRIRFPTV